MGKALAFLSELFAPRGNLLTADIMAEVTMHVLTDRQVKTIISKYPDNPQQEVTQALIQGLLNAAVGIAKERRVSIDWNVLRQAHPPYPEHVAMRPPPSPAPGG